MSVLLSFSLNTTVEKIDGPNGSFAEIELISGKRLHVIRLCGKEEEDGVALISRIVERVLKEELILTATAGKDTNHIFYLLMGMAPSDYPLCYVIDKYGQNAYRALNALKTGKPDPQQLQMLKEIWANEGGQAEVSGEEIYEQKEFLIALLNKPHFYVKGKFIPSLLSLMKQDLKTIHSKGTKELGCMVMQLSEMGQNRWAKAIQEGSPFLRFERMEHLRRSMTSEQQKQLDQIVKN